MTSNQKNTVLIQGGGRFTKDIHDKLIKELKQGDKLRVGYTKEQQKNILEIQKKNTETVHLDLEDDKTIDASLKDVRDLVMIPPFKANRVDLCKHFIDKAVTAGVTRIILISVQGASSGEFQWANDMYNIEQKLMGCGVTYTILRSSLHQETFTYLKDAIKSGTLFLPTAGNKFIPVCFKDITELCVKFILNPDIGRNKIFDATGPSAMNGTEIAQDLEEALGRNVKFVSISVDEYKNKLKAGGMHNVKAESIGDLLGWYAQGKGSRPIADYTPIMLRDPILLRDYVLEHKTEFV